MDLSFASSITQVLVIEDSSQIGNARRKAQKLAEQVDFDEVDAARVALVATELASNVLKHATRGELHLRVAPGLGVSGVEIIAVDRGPGFDLHECLTDGYSTGGTKGIGLGALARQAQVFDVYADSRGSVVLVRLYPRTAKGEDYPIGITQHSLHNDPACGDVWHLAVDGPRISALIVDGLGHGPDAERAGQAGALEFAQNPFGSPEILMGDMHRAMNGTRGGAAAIARFDGATGVLHFSGVGNIGASLIGTEKTRGLASHPGIVGVQFRKAHAFEYPQADKQLLIMYSDGLQSRWNLHDYPGLAARHPAVISAILHRDFCRGRDDVTVLVLVLEAKRV